MAPDAAAAAGGKKRKRYLPHNVSSSSSPLPSISTFLSFYLFSESIFPLIFAETSEEGFVSITPWCARFFHHLRWWKRTPSHS